MNLARYRKLIAAALGLAATLVSSGVLDGTAEAIVSGVLAVATVLGVYAAPNQPALDRTL